MRLKLERDDLRKGDEKVRGEGEAKGEPGSELTRRMSSDMGVDLRDLVRGRDIMLDLAASVWTGDFRAFGWADFPMSLGGAFS